MDCESCRFEVEEGTGHVTVEADLTALPEVDLDRVVSVVCAHCWDWMQELVPRSTRASSRAGGCESCGFDVEEGVGCATVTVDLSALPTAEVDEVQGTVCAHCWDWMRELAPGREEAGREEESTPEQLLDVEQRA